MLWRKSEGHLDKRNVIHYEYCNDIEMYLKINLYLRKYARFWISLMKTKIKNLLVIAFFCKSDYSTYVHIDSLASIYTQEMFQVKNFNWLQLFTKNSRLPKKPTNLFTVVLRTKIYHSIVVSFSEQFLFLIVFFWSLLNLSLTYEQPYFSYFVL